MLSTVTLLFCCCCSFLMKSSLTWFTIPEVELTYAHNNASQLTLHLSFYFIKKSWEHIKKPRSPIFQQTREYSISKLKLWARKKNLPLDYLGISSLATGTFCCQENKNPVTRILKKSIVIQRLSF